MTTKTVTFRVKSHTPGAIKCEEIDVNDNPAKEDYLIGTLYLRKSAVGEVPIGTKFKATVDIDDK